ncbi:MAG: 2-oxoacid:acceptor oxidoreductase subunit alpha [Candidatus Dormibacteraeota bacterium]|nr:2-oxoacid:acceptor oxidoreductase subunit alpha [Candidatus Dormibacteraeota bacterium]MBV9526729.1 2-oxoacid:acceptor oxidoreductase subunit alpha [Candidatus Dormibacteraeota bacterium]
MAVTLPGTEAGGAADGVAPRVNDFAVKLANVNGTGSSSANNLLMRAMFRMGVPVSGKNLFPSNIQGLPTWYEIRVNKTGFVARAREYDVMVAMNAQTYAADIREVRSGGFLLYDSSWPLDQLLVRNDVTYLGVPLARMVNEAFRGARERILMKNIAYAGALVAVLGIDMEIISDLLTERFAGKEKLRESNQRALRLGYDYALEHFECPIDCHVERMEKYDDLMLIDGNTAAALGCVYAGATVAAWYPITPSTSLMDAFTRFCERYRRDPETGRNDYLVVQAEDELASIGIVLGASWAGARAFTSTSGPGISLMNELLGMGYYAEIPAVIVDVQRVGPSTGMPTRTQQGDILACAYASHGDTKHILLFPCNPTECFELAVKAFDLAERFQTPVIMLSDLDIGMNDWVTPTLTWDDSYRPDRGRVLGADELEDISVFHRYDNEDADFVTPRTLPGVSEKGAYFTRGSGHTREGAYTETPDEYQAVVDRLAHKHRSAARAMPEPAIELREGARAGVVTVGGCDLAVREALQILEQRGIALDFLRVRGFPFGPAVEDFLDKHDLLFVVEQNRDAQLRSLLVLETPVPKDRLRSVLVYGGYPLSAADVVDSITAQLGA